MTVRSSLEKARDEVKKAFKEKKMSPKTANAFIAVLVAMFQRIKEIFQKTYLFIFFNLNKIFPLPFVKEPKPKVRTKTVKQGKENDKKK